MAESKKSYPVLSSVLHDGELYTPGKPIDLTDAQAQPLRAAGAIGEPVPAEDAGKDKGKSKS